MSVIRSIAGIVLSTTAAIAPAHAESMATVSFSGYVAPACIVTNIEDDQVLPRGANPQDYLLLRCNTGAPDRLIRRDDRSSQNTMSVRSSDLVTESSVTIVP